jgi:hypothetical protein
MKSVPTPFLLACVWTASLAACTSTSDAARETETGAPITADNLAGRIEHLSSDQFEGRAPASPGGQAASAWIAEGMARIGLAPAGEDGSYFQSVPLVRSTLQPEASYLEISDSAGQARRLAYGPEAVFWTKKVEDDVSFEDSELVFVGYGATAPEYDWDDYAGLDVAGKTLVMLVNDPGYATGDPELFTGNAMTYYGRWTSCDPTAGRAASRSRVGSPTTPPRSCSRRRGSISMR